MSICCKQRSVAFRHVVASVLWRIMLCKWLVMSGGSNVFESRRVMRSDPVCKKPFYCLCQVINESYLRTSSYAAHFKGQSAAFLS
jgi:hypothetical protein